MEFPEDHTHAFIVRFWLESREIQGPIWRGLIEHVHGEKRLLKDLDEIPEFIRSVHPEIKFEVC